MRGLAYRKFQRENHIKRKEEILRAYRLDNPPHKYNDKDLFGSISLPLVYINNYEGFWLPYYIVKHRGQLNKGKIHCSCHLCSVKTRNKGKRRHLHGNYAPSVNYKVSDLKKIEKMDFDDEY